MLWSSEFDGIDEHYEICYGTVNLMALSMVTSPRPDSLNFEEVR